MSSNDLKSMFAAALQVDGVPATPQNVQDLMYIAQHESSGEPGAVNGWDSNAKAGHPSEGLMQMIGPTFQANMKSGYGDIMNPLDNAIAAINYMNSKYGGVNQAYNYWLKNSNY